MLCPTPDEIENLKQFIYFSTLIDCEESSTNYTESLISKARTAFNKLSKVWSSNQYRRKTMLRIYQSDVVSLLMSGSEHWKISKRDGDKLNAFRIRCLQCGK